MQNISHSASRQHGSALVMILIMLGVFATLLVSALKSNPQIARDKISADAMAQAKDALIGYATTYRDTHSSSGRVFGYLPCPDMGTGIAGTEGSEAPSCTGANNKGISALGRLPWKTLGLLPLRDSSGECLWYAVSGSFKNNTQPDLLNWDSDGQFQILAENGTSVIAGTSATAYDGTHPVAIIFSAGAPLTGQNRTPDSPPPVSGVAECGGNYTPSNYLDTLAGVNNSVVSTVANAITQFITGKTSDTFNDKFLYVTADDIFKRIKQRRDFNLPAWPAPSPNGDVNNLIASVAACLNAQATLPTPVTINFSTMAETTAITSGSVISGRVPQTYVNTNCSISTAPESDAWRSDWNTRWWQGTSTFTGKNFYNNWQDNLLYAKCSSGQCLTVNSSPCAAVLVFSGERDATTSPAQNRATAANKNIWSNYLEGNFLGLFTSGTPTSFTGALTVFTIANVNTAATADIFACINPSSSGSWPFEYSTQWAGAPPLDAANVAVGGTTNTSGTSGNDDVSITGNLSVSVNLLSGNDELLVTGNFTGSGNFGAGDDTIKIGGNSTGSIDLGSGDDYLDIGGNSQGSIDAGTGDDKILVGGDATASLSLGAGNDELHIKGDASGSIDAGNGDNKIRIDGSMSANIQVGSGDDYVLVFGDAATMDAGAGHDVILIGGNATAWLNLGAGNDYLEILGNSVGLNAGNGNDIIKITGSATNTIDLGAGDDILVVGGTITWINGGGGNDKLYLKNETTTNCASLLIKIAGDVENVKVSNGMCRGSTFTVPLP